MISTSVAIALLMVLADPSIALSTPKAGRQFIEITNPLKQGTSERLPSSFVRDWPTWILSDSGLFSKVPADKGFVDPTTIDEIWQPIDLKQPECRLALGLHIRNGQIRHVMPAVDLSFDGEHRNRGLCSYPRAYSWVDFGSIMAGNLGSCGLELQAKPVDSDENGWVTLLEVASIKPFMDYALQAISDHPPSELGQGSSVIHVVCEESFAECPKPGNKLRALLLEDETEIGALEVSIEKTAAGSDSEYLPDCYKSLFQDESLRRPAYDMIKQRRGKMKNI